MPAFEMILGTFPIVALIFVHTKLRTASAATIAGQNCNDPQCFASTRHLIELLKYPVEDHQTVTTDGYVLGLQRIPSGLRETPSNCKYPKPAVLLVHGIFRSSATFVLTPAEYNLGCSLADAGFDVWLANLRATPSSRQNLQFNISEPGYWNFNFDNVALNDMSSFIDYITYTTKNQQVAVIGHSQGTTATLALLSGKPEYNQKVSQAFLMAPLAVITDKPMDVTAKKNEMFGDEAQQGVLKFFAPTEAVFPTVEGYYADLASGKCNVSAGIQFLCNFALPNYTGDPYVNQTKLPVYFSLFPTSVSAYELQQAFQVLYANRLQRFDYGGWRNIGNYGTIKPPAYDLKKVTAPVSLFSSEGDTVSKPAFVDYIRKRLSNIKTDKVIPNMNGVGFTHIDFVLANEAKALVYQDIIAELQKFKPCAEDTGYSSNNIY